MTQYNEDTLNTLRHVGGITKCDLNNILRCSQFQNDDFMAVLAHSPYYDMDSLESILPSNVDKFSILSLNIQSINAKFDSLCALISILADKNFQFSVICLQETWLDEQADSSLFELPNYNLVSRPKSCCGHGGLLTYIHQDFSFVVRDMNFVSNICEGLFIDVFNNSMDRKITISNIYRPPKMNDCNAILETFLNQMRPIVTSLSKENSHAVFVGDYNIDLLKIDNREKYQEYFDLFVTNAFLPNIVLPTRFSRRNATLIDQLFSKSPSPTTHNVSGILLNNMSDHLPFFTCLDICNRTHKTPKFIKINRNDPKSFDQYTSYIQNEISIYSFDKVWSNDPTPNYKKMGGILDESREKYLQPITVKFNRYKHKLNPWMTAGILRSIKFRDKLYKKLKSMHPSTIAYQNADTNLRTYKSILQKSIRLAKMNYYGSQFEKYRGDVKRTWAAIKEILNRNKKSTEFPKYFVINGSKISDAKLIANNFNTFFANVGPNLSRNIKSSSNKSIQYFLTMPVNTSFSFHTISESDVLKVIQELKPKTSFGHDHISTNVLKRITHIILPTLTLIINQSLVTGIFPNQLKIARVIPLYKKDDETILDNYRPISLLTSISKVFEKIVFKQMYEYFTSNNLFYDHQYGYRTLHSTELATMEMTDRILLDIDNKKLPISVFLDLSKAFDTLDHDILLQKLQYYGVSDIPLRWLNSYLTERQQYVDFNGTKSISLPVQTGVPQGSILGPLLFIIYMNDVHMASNYFTPIVYADDTNLYSTLGAFSLTTPINTHNFKELSDSINTELNNISDWLAINKLSLNVKKTKYMIFHSKQRNVSHINLDLKINNHPIDRVKDFNFLGLTIDDTLSWKDHIQKISTKISRVIGVLNRLKKFLPSSILILLYNSLILPHLQYCSLVWGFRPGRIVKLQKRAVRLITNSKYNAHTEPLFKKMNLLKFEDIFKCNALRFIYKILNKSLPQYFIDIFSPVSQDRIYTTRESSKLSNRLRRYCANTQGALHCMRHYLPRLLDETPEHVTNKLFTHSFTGFSRYIKFFHIGLYNINCDVIDCYVCNQAMSHS